MTRLKFVLFSICVTLSLVAFAEPKTITLSSGVELSLNQRSNGSTVLVYAKAGSKNEIARGQVHFGVDSFTTGAKEPIVLLVEHRLVIINGDGYKTINLDSVEIGKNLAKALKDPLMKVRVVAKRTSESVLMSINAWNENTGMAITKKLFYNYSDHTLMLKGKDQVEAKLLTEGNQIEQIKAYNFNPKHGLSFEAVFENGDKIPVSIAKDTFDSYKTTKASHAKISFIDGSHSDPLVKSDSVPLFADQKLFNNTIVTGKKYSSKNNQNVIDSKSSVFLDDPSFKRLPEFSLENFDVVVQDKEGNKVPALDIIDGVSVDLIEKAKKLILSDSNVPMDKQAKEFARSINQILLMAETGSVKALGPAGTGKSYMMNQLIAELIQGNGPSQLIEKSYWLGVSASSLSAGNQYVGNFETIINAISQMAEALKANGYQLILVVDEVHALKGVGASKNDNKDITELLKPQLADGTLKILGLSTTAEWNAAFSGDKAWNSRFEEAQFKEPSKERVLPMLQFLANKHYSRKLSLKNAGRIYDIADRFDNIGNHPRKSSKFLHRIMSYMMETNRKHVSVKLIDEIATQKYHLDPSVMDPAKAGPRIELVMQKIEERVKGQAAAKQAIKETLIQSVLAFQAQLKKPNILFSGPKGQGKTFIPQVLAESLDVPFIRVSMNEISSVIELKQDLVSKLRGASGNSAFAVILFDEIEKANLQVQQASLEILDSRKMTVLEQLGNTETKEAVEVSLANNEVFVATNAGQDYLTQISGAGAPKKGMGFTNELSEVVEVAYNQQAHIASMSTQLDEFVLDRMQKIVPFFPLQAEGFQAVFSTKLNTVLKSLKAGELTVLVDKALPEVVAAYHYSPGYSNRRIDNLLDQITVEIAAASLIHQGKELYLSFESGKFRVSSKSYGPGSNFCSQALK